MHRLAGLVMLLVLVGNPALGADNPYEVAGISDPAHVTQFLARLKTAVTDGDTASVASMIEYPLAVHGHSKKPLTYRNSNDLRVHYQDVFTPDVIEAVKSATIGNLFVRDQGVMIGDGQVWMAEIDGTMKIIAVNQTR